MSLAARLRSWSDARWMRPAGLVAVLVVLAAALFGVFWGALVADPDVRIRDFDAGPLSQFAIGSVVAYPEVNVYVIGLEDGRLRAVDGIVRDTDCAVEWLPEDVRGSAANPRGTRGAYRDPCSGALWAATGDALDGTDQPLRTFVVAYRSGDDGVPHLRIEVLGRRTANPR